LFSCCFLLNIAMLV